MQDIGDDPNIVFSCVEFNETADKPFEAAPPSVAAAKLRQRKGITPADGTVYMAGWQAAYCNCFGIVLDHFSRGSLDLHHPTTPYNILYQVTVPIACCLVLTIRWYADSYKFNIFFFRRRTVHQI